MELKEKANIRAIKISSPKKYDTIILCKKKGALNMEITITAAAIEKINEKTAGRDGYLKLKYDTEGCGCVVSGVAALWLVPQLEDDDIAIETNDQKVYLEKSKMVFFDEQMKIDFSKASNCFQLKSPQQILNGHMSFILKEKTD